jgi:23S rRNA pseudouridine2605 synthase
MDDVSLARALSKLGWCSRAEARRIVAAGRVAVDGAVVKDAERRVDMRRARITVDGERVRAANNVYVMMHKPRGVVTTAADERGRRTVYELLPAELPRVVAVGRLDMDSEGLLLFTNDTRWADRLLDPARHVDKTYEAELDDDVSDDTIERMLRGVTSRGETLRLKSVRRMHAGAGNWLEIVIDEGKNRQIRRVLEASGVRVLRLIRTRIGQLDLGSLAAGATRRMNAEEKLLAEGSEAA